LPQVRIRAIAALVNKLVEAKQQLQLRRVLARWVGGRGTT
jgi:hypothetical protein